MKNKILNTNQIKKIVKRIAYQIHENNLECSEIVLIGVYKNGYVLAEIIENEDKSNPYNDDVLTELIAQKGFKIARRTVGKYREHMNIPPARLRKQL